MLSLFTGTDYNYRFTPLVVRSVTIITTKNRIPVGTIITVRMAVFCV